LNFVPREARMMCDVRYGCTIDSSTGIQHHVDQISDAQ
jgi:hypothetical protein